MTTITRPCPHCGTDYDITRRLNGDVCWCSCGKWFRVVIRLHGQVYLAKAEPPPGTEDAQETSADAALLAEMSALRAELLAVKEDNAALLIALREIDSSEWLPPRVQYQLGCILLAEHPGRALMGELTRQQGDMRRACEDLITAMVQLGKEHHREVAFARDVLGQKQALIAAYGETTEMEALRQLHRAIEALPDTEYQPGCDCEYCAGIDAARRALR